MSLKEEAGSRFGELDAVRLYCQFVNALDVEPFLEKLAPDVLYSSHWVLEDLTSAEAVAMLLRGKVKLLRQESPRTMQALPGVSMNGWQYGRPIAILCKPGAKSCEATVEFKVNNGQISVISIVSPGMHKPAYLTDPDNYIWPPDPPVEAETTPAIRQRPEPPDPDPAAIIATFANVDEIRYAPIADEDIRTCAKKVWGSLEVSLVPHDHEPIQGIDHPELGQVLESARLGEVFVIALSYPETHGLIGIMTVPRPQSDWSSIRLTAEEWYLQQGRKPYEFGIDFNEACELRLFCVGGLIRQFRRIVARPRPSLAIAEMESRYRAIRAATSEPLSIGETDVATWPRFLDRAREAAHSIARKLDPGQMTAGSPQRRIAELALAAWPRAGES